MFFEFFFWKKPLIIQVEESCRRVKTFEIEFDYAYINSPQDCVRRLCRKVKDIPVINIERRIIRFSTNSSLSPQPMPQLLFFHYIYIKFAFFPSKFFPVFLSSQQKWFNKCRYYQLTNELYNALDIPSRLQEFLTIIERIESICRKDLRKSVTDLIIEVWRGRKVTRVMTQLCIVELWHHDSIVISHRRRIMASRIMNYGMRAFSQMFMPQHILCWYAKGYYYDACRYAKAIKSAIIELRCRGRCDEAPANRW